MGVKYFDDWVEKERLVKHGSLDILKGSVIGVDAAHFAKQYLVEPLLTALGGAPIALENFTSAIQALRDAEVEMHFVFNGLPFGKRHDPFASSHEISVQNAAAFSQYEDSEAEHARRAFQSLAATKLDDYMDTIKAALHRLEVPFTVAPYSALAQLSYYERHPRQFVDAIYGPTELLYFGVDKVITEFNSLGSKHYTDDSSLPESSSALDQAQFCWIETSACLRALGGIHQQLFSEALILAGSDLFLSTYPPLLTKAGVMYSHQNNIIREAVNFLVAARGNLSQALETYGTEKDRWLNEYGQVMTIIKHHVVLTVEGDVESLDKEHAPTDIHACIGLRLPEELYFYLSRGAIGVRVLNCLTRSEVMVTTPLAAAAVAVYQEFVRSQVDQLRRQAICLLTEGLHRYYQRTEFQIRFWFDRNIDEKFKPLNVNPSPHTLVARWNVRDGLLSSAKETSRPPGSLCFAVLSLQDVDFAKRTVTPRSKNASPLNSRQEVLANTLWRFLQLRDFVDEQHQLTIWGKVLCAALSSIQGSDEAEKSVFIAIEMLRFGLLNLVSMSPDDIGSAGKGTAQDRDYCTLVSRVASLGRLRHKAKGYSGPLSRSLLAYHSIVSTLQLSLRDLAETNMIAAFLDGSISRDREDWMVLSLSLPFYELSSCSLGVAVLSYLDNLELHGDPTTQTAQAQTRADGQKWIQYSEFEASLGDAFDIWDAVYQGVKSAGDLVKERQLWDQTNTWLSQRR